MDWAVDCLDGDLRMSNLGNNGFILLERRCDPSSRITLPMTLTVCMGIWENAPSPLAAFRRRLSPTAKLTACLSGPTQSQNVSVSNGVVVGAMLQLLLLLLMLSWLPSRLLLLLLLLLMLPG